ncbi:MAG: sulfatase-like hydrolase/transferase [Armatimonadota bacterium]|nr:sulfatase-like hydrolase/transferase [Armatimonadota bacterium]
MGHMSRRDFIRVGAGAAIGMAGINPLIAEGVECKSSEQTSVPNLLFIMTDQQRWDALSCAGNRILKTPNLDRFAKEGVRFERAFSACPVCVPARMAILTGHNGQTTGIRCNYDVDRKGYATIPTFDNILAERGVWTEYYGKWHSPTWRALDYKNPERRALNLGSHYLNYLDKHVPIRQAKEGEQLDDLFSHRPYKPDPIDLRYGLPTGSMPNDENGKPIKILQPDCLGCLDVPAEYTPTAFCANNVIEALERLKDQRFSITCSIHHPHSPMTPSKPYYGMYPAADMPLPASIDDPMTNSPYAIARKMRGMTTSRPKEMFRYMISNYYGLVYEIDYHVGRILSKLKELGLEKNTLVIFTSDHGEMLGSHNLREKNVFYEESAHVPLMIRMPGAIPANKVVKEPVSHLDLYATIMDYLKVSGQTSEGSSLRPLVAGKNRSAFDYVVSDWDVDNVPNFMVRNKEWKLLFCRTGDQNRLDGLYNLKDDPYETNNLIGDNPDRAKLLPQAEEMKERLVEWLAKTESPFLDAVKQRKIH